MLRSRFGLFDAKSLMRRRVRERDNGRGLGNAGAVTDGCRRMQAGSGDMAFVVGARRRLPLFKRNALPALLRAHGDAECLPLLHRCAILYLMVPVLVWLVGWFEWWFGLPAALLVGMALVPALRGRWRPPRPSRDALAIAGLGFACTMLTAHGGLFDGNNFDWWDRRALLLDLSRHPWPVRLRDGLADYLPWGGGERQALLRYYLAWYMVPGLAGRLFGAAALNWAVPLWSGLGITLVLLLFAHGLGRRRAVVAAGMFVLFSGMDALRALLSWGTDWFQLGIDSLGWPGIHLRYHELMAFAGRWTVYLSNFESFRYAPDILAAALCTLLILHLRRHPRFVAASGVVLAAAPLWSPFVALGLLPYVAILLCDNAMRRPAALASWSNLCLAVPLAGLLAAYLSSGALDFGQGWLWEGHNWRRMVGWARRFYASEFLVLLLFLLLLRPRYARDLFFAAMSAALLVLPLYRVGDLNLTMRGALPSLVLLCWFCSRGLLVPAARTGGRCAQAARGLGFAGVACCLAVGAAGPLLHLATATRDDVTFRYALSGFTTFAMVGRPRENLAVEVPPMLAKVLPERDVEAPSAAGEPAFRADFDIHVRDRNLVLVNERCEHDDRFLQVRFPPANQNTNAQTEWHIAPRWYGAGCGAMFGLPGWPVHSARVGQTPPDGGDWAVEILLDEAGEAAGLSHPPACSFHYGEAGRRCPGNPGVAALRRAYDRVRSARSAVPVARRRFDVYVDDEWIIYVREPCVFNDMKDRFFLHLTPADVADRPEAGPVFDNQDFAFGERGGMFDGKCVAVLRLPYALRELRTGQLSAAGEVWSAVFRPSE